jgi:lipoate-protein ligase A
VNRRITGGGALLFDQTQIGWEIIGDKAFFNVHLPTDALFARLCEPTAAALRGLGLNARYRPRNDIEVDGRKISGTGGTDCDAAFLFQGTLLMDFDVEGMLSCLRVPTEKLRDTEKDAMRRRVTCLAWELGRVPPAGDVKEALAESFARHLGVTLVPGGLSPEEQDLLAEKLPYFQSDDWIDMIRPDFEQAETLQATRATSFGHVRCTLVVNRAKHILKDVFITGDFLAFPSRALLDLEAALRGRPLEPESLGAVVEDFFATGKLAIHGMGAGDLRAPLAEALSQTGGATA